MNGTELNTEQIILEAAEAEFFETGYAGAKTVSIARRAGISHSMLHYYFRT
ncbi:MAG: TetR/AcrR family transcriptional regulator, partial [Tannerella sp.]|nr:TetR/AcrR family transcriptional regulator [Tannerella sp.]